MAKSKKKWVAFKSNVTVPADVMGEEEDQKMQVGEPVQLPEGYAVHVVQDGYAEYCDAPKRVAPAKPVEQSDDEKAAAQKLAAAQAHVEQLEAELGGMAENDAGRQALAGKLGQAKADLAALRPAT